MLSLSAQYLVRERTDDGRPIDPVARSRLGDGARPDRTGWLADTSAKGCAEPYGQMLNDRYVTDDIKANHGANHEAFARRGAVAVPSSACRLLRSQRSAERSTTPTEPTKVAGQ